MLIERMKISDCAEASEIEKMCFSVPWSKESLEGEFHHDYAVYFAARAEGKLVGYVGVHNVCGQGEITMIAVHPGHRRLGIAQKLLETLVKSEREMGIVQINLEVRESNVAAHCLYKKLGFEALGVRKNYYTDPVENAVLMSLDISGKDE